MVTLLRLMQFMLIMFGVLGLLFTPRMGNPEVAGLWYVAPVGSDSNPCDSPTTPCATINGAITKAMPGDTIQVASGTYTNPVAANEVVLVNKDIVLSGGWSSDFTVQNSSSTVDGQNARRGVTVNPGTSAVMEYFIVQNGSAQYGGGISNEGNLTVNRTLVTQNNHVNLENSAGGGIFIASGATATINNSSFVGNKAYDGGGIYINENATAGINNTTISGNEAAYFGGGLWSHGTTSINNVTITNNTIIYGGAGGAEFCGTDRLQNSIIAGNKSSNSQDCSICFISLTSAGYNIFGNTSGCANFTPGPGDQLNLIPQLFPLMGNPPYHPITSMSPGVDAGNPAGCTDNLGNPLTTDQRGVARAGICDIGAYEVDPAHDPLSYCLLSFVNKSCPPLFSDNFNNPNSGWPVSDNGHVLYEYKNGEYRILVRDPGLFAGVSPYQAGDFSVSVDLRNLNGVFGSYGINFGNWGDWSQFYTLEIYPDGWYGIYRYDPGGYVTLAEEYSSAIFQGSGTNSIKVERNGVSIKAYANGKLLASVTDGTYMDVRLLGLVAMTTNQANLDIRYDNFIVYPLLGCRAATSASVIAGGSLQAPKQPFLNVYRIENAHPKHQP